MIKPVIALIAAPAWPRSWCTTSAAPTTSVACNMSTPGTVKT